MADTPDTEGRNLIELLDMLRPVPEPEPVPMWPATSAWIWLAAVVLALLVWAGRKIWQHRRANAYRRAGLAELEAAGDDPAAIAGILRRTALVAYPRRQVAALTGPDWLGFLDQAYGGQGFTTGPGQILSRAPYQPQPASAELTRLVRTWLKSHKRPAAGEIAE